MLLPPSTAGRHDRMNFVTGRSGTSAIRGSRYTDNEAYYGSVDRLIDIFGPLASVADVEIRDVGDIGSGPGRIFLMLMEAGARHVPAVEPSEAFNVLQKNVATQSEKVTAIRCRGEQISVGLNFDFVTSMGVLHHIPDPRPVVDATLRSLTLGGKFVIWLCGREGNSTYPRLITPLRAVRTRLPQRLVSAISYFLNVVLGVYIARCSRFRLPLYRYMREVIGPFTWRKRQLVIFDQL